MPLQEPLASGECTSVLLSKTVAAGKTAENRLVTATMR
jgi:hypothetical protein